MAASVTIGERKRDLDVLRNVDVCPINKDKFLQFQEMAD